MLRLQISGGSRICQGRGEVDHGERAEREPKRGSGGRPQRGPGGRAFGGGLGSPTEAEGFLYIFIQKVAKS